MSKDLPDLSDREVVQLMAAQRIVMDRPELHDAYTAQVAEYGAEYGVEVSVDE